MSDFWELVRTAEANPSAADFKALRAAYVASDIYRPFKHIPQWKLLQITNGAQDFQEVLTTCQNLLQGNPLDLEARMMLGMAQAKIGDHQAAEKNHAFAEGMLDAILASGDGKTLESAFHLVAENEAWTVMRSFGIKATGHTRQQAGAKAYDVFEGKIGDRQVTVYFDVSDILQAFDDDIIGEKE